MLVPVMRTWAAGEIIANSYLAANIQQLGNFLLGPPVAVLRQTVAQSIPSGTATAVLFDTEDVDRDNAHSTSANTSRYTAQTPGWYDLTAAVGFAANATGIREFYFQINGTGSAYADQTVDAPTAATACTRTLATVVYLNVNDYVEVYAYQTSGAALNFQVRQGNPRFTIRWVSQ